MTRKTPKKQSAPNHLRPESRAWFEEIAGSFILESHHLKVLCLCCEAWDRVQQAKAAIAKEGMIYLDRFGTPRARPEISIERDSRIAFARLLRELALDVAPPPEAPRPPSRTGV